MVLISEHTDFTIDNNLLEQLIKLDSLNLDFPWSKNQWDDFLNSSSNWIVYTATFEQDQYRDLIGFALFELSYDKWTSLLKIAIDHSYRNKGYAKRILRRSIEGLEHKGFDSILLEVREANLVAIELYKAMGFVIDRIASSYYSDGQSAVKMLCALR